METNAKLSGHEEQYVQPGAQLYVAILRYSMQRAPRKTVVDAFFRLMRGYGHWDKTKSFNTLAPFPEPYRQTVLGGYTGLSYYVANGAALDGLNPRSYYAGRTGEAPFSPGLDSPEHAEAYIEMVECDLADECAGGDL